MVSNKMGRFMAVPDSNATIWQQLIATAGGFVGQLFTWKNPMPHAIIIKDFYIRFKTHTGTATNAVAAFVGLNETTTAVGVTALPVGTLVPAVVVSAATQFVVGAKDILVPKDGYIQIAASTDAGAGIATRASSAAVTGVVGFKYAMIPEPEQIL